MSDNKAASQSTMNRLHDRVADMFIKVLARYNMRMDAVEQLTDGSLSQDSISDEVLTALLDDGAMPSPAMMSAITKFLKDNEVLFEKGKVDEMSAQARALEEKRKNRPNLATLTIVPKAESA